MQDLPLHHWKNVFGTKDLVSGRQHISYFRSATGRIKSLRTGTAARNSRANSPTSKKVSQFQNRVQADWSRFLALPLLCLLHNLQLLVPLIERALLLTGHFLFLSVFQPCHNNHCYQVTFPSESVSLLILTATCWESDFQWTGAVTCQVLNVC